MGSRPRQSAEAPRPRAGRWPCRLRLSVTGRKEEAGPCGQRPRPAAAALPEGGERHRWAQLNPLSASENWNRCQHNTLLLLSEGISQAHKQLSTSAAGPQSVKPFVTGWDKSVKDQCVATIERNKLHPIPAQEDPGALLPRSREAVPRGISVLNMPCF